jgi:UDP-galactopyranose mutase
MHRRVPALGGRPLLPHPPTTTRALYKRYEALAAERDVTFVGRLARYQYLNMDQVVAQALSTYEKLVAKQELAGSVEGSVS